VDEANLQKAKNTKLELMRALHFIHPKEENWKIPVLLGSALEQ
jgi:LAO/AO transport system kinase